VNWRSYSVADFIPYSRDVYLQLLSATNQLFWPWHILLLASIGLFAFFAVTARTRLSGILLASGWCWTGYAFFFNYYRHLNWAGEYFAIACGIQAALTLILFNWGRRDHGPTYNIQRYSGYICLACGVCWPLVCLLGREGASQMEWIGLHPEPTAIATIGVALLLFRGWQFWCLVLWPVLWLMWAALTLMVLAFPQSQFLFGVLILLVAAKSVIAFKSYWLITSGNH